MSSLAHWLLLVGGEGGQGEWEREREVRGCEIVCLWMLGRVRDRVRYVMH